MELYLLRHGEAVGGEEWHGGEAERPLTKAGSARMKAEARSMEAMGLRAGAILSSPLVRARQTAEIVARELGCLGALAVEERLAPGFGTDDLAAILVDHPGCTALMLVGHEPDFSRLIASCTGGSRVICKKGGLARIDVENPRTLAGVLVWLLPPRVLAPDHRS